MSRRLTSQINIIAELGRSLTSTFDIDEDALKHGPGIMAWMAVKELMA